MGLRLEMALIPFGRRFTAALVVYALLIPYVAAVITITAHLAPTPVPPKSGWITEGWLTDNFVPDNAFVAGIILTLILWALLALLTSTLVRNRFAAADGVNPGTYQEVLNRYNVLCMNLEELCRNNCPGDCRDIACKNAWACRNGISTTLNSTGLQWVRGGAYVAAWKMLYRAEEELIYVQPIETVIEGAVADHSRLKGSNIQKSDELTAELERAAIGLRPSLAPFLTSATLTPEQPHATSGPEQQELKAILKQVRHAINEYRIDQWSGVLRIRNRLLVTTIGAGLSAYLLLGLAITVDDSWGNPSIVASSVFFLVGAIAGLFSLLRTSIEANATNEDHGLGIARLFATPLFSGLAAIGGVLLAGVLSGLAEDGSGAIPSLWGMQGVFSLDLTNLIIAAFFGLTPSVFADRLGQADKLLANLRSTRPADESTAQPSG